MDQYEYFLVQGVSKESPLFTYVACSTDKLTTAVEEMG